jgi:hypothetical protein
MLQTRSSSAGTMCSNFLSLWKLTPRPKVKFVMYLESAAT